MNVDIVIPSKGRQQMLKGCLDSLAEEIVRTPQHTFKVIVYVDSKKEYDDLHLYKIIHPLHIWVSGRVLNGNYRAPHFWNDYLKDMKADALIYLNDDCKVQVNCLRNGLLALQEKFNGDGVIGFNQSNATTRGTCPAAFGIIGSKYADRFPERKVWCPEYHCLYTDQELYEYAEKIGKFYYAEQCSVLHFHPVFTGKTPDKTHMENRKNKSQDVATHNLRVSKKLLWGDSFERVNK